MRLTVLTMTESETLVVDIVAVFRQSPEGLLLDCNEECARLLGYESREELLAVGRLDYVNRSDFISVASALRDLQSLSNVEIGVRFLYALPLFFPSSP